MPTEEFAAMVKGATLVNMTRSTPDEQKALVGKQVSWRGLKAVVDRPFSARDAVLLFDNGARCKAPWGELEP